MTAIEKNTDTEMLNQTLRQYAQAQNIKENWVNIWQDCYDYALPQRASFTQTMQRGASRMEHIFDATAMDAVDSLASSMLANLTPLWTQWFGLKPGPDLSAEEADKIAPALEKIGKTIQDHFDRSNFAVEIHQCYLDLIVGGTASLHFEENQPGAFSAFKFKSTPLNAITLAEGQSGYLDTTYRSLHLTLDQLKSRYPDPLFPLPDMGGNKESETYYNVLELVKPSGLIYEYQAIMIEEGIDPYIIAKGVYQNAPFINFRWLKTPGEIYGRSPVMKALPDIKTANKVVELTLKNASIAVAGIWQADDDGVLNPANIQLTPGSIIPKAIGSKGLQALDMPGRFDISQLVLDNLQSSIRHALLADKLAPINSPRMSATEVLERSAEMSMLLGATYGRLQTELLTPLIKRAFAILKRRGEIPDLTLDGRLVVVDYRSPLARSQGQRNVQNTLSWINSVLSMGSEAQQAIDLPEAARFLGEAMGVPSNLIIKKDRTIADELSDIKPVVDALAQSSSDAAQQA